MHHRMPPSKTGRPSLNVVIGIISSFTHLSNGWNDVLGKYLVKETV
jgi:hypothetical protein